MIKTTHVSLEELLSPSRTTLSHQEFSLIASNLFNITNLEDLINNPEVSFEPLIRYCQQHSSSTSMKILNTLLKYHDFNCEELFHHFPLYQVCFQRHSRVLKKYLDYLETHDISCNIVDCLDEPCRKGYIDIIEMILKCSKVELHNECKKHIGLARENNQQKVLELLSSDIRYKDLEHSRTI